MVEGLQRSVSFQVAIAVGRDDNIRTRRPSKNRIRSRRRNGPSNRDGQEDCQSVAMITEPRWHRAGTCQSARTERPLAAETSARPSDRRRANRCRLIDRTRAKVFILLACIIKLPVLAGKSRNLRRQCISSARWSQSTRGRTRQTDGEACAFAFLTRHVDAAAMQVDRQFDEIKPYTGTDDPRNVAAAVIPFEQPVEVVAGECRCRDPQ